MIAAVAALLLVTLGAALYAMETALTTLSRGPAIARGAEDEVERRRVTALIEHPGRHLFSSHIARTFAAVGTVFAGLSASGAPIEGVDFAVSQAAAVTGLVLLLVATQAFGRVIALTSPERTLATTSRLYQVVNVVTGPLAVVLSMMTGPIFRGAGVPQDGARQPPTADDLQTQATAALAAGAIEPEEQEMIHSIIELDRTSVREVMVPRVDVTALPASTTVAAALSVISDVGYSRLPVYRASIDEIAGILYAKDLLKHFDPDAMSRPIGDLVRPALFVPETKKTDELLRDLRRQRVHIAIVIDEFGGTAGIVTIEDLLEEIVGEIQDEFDHEEMKIIQLGSDETLVDASVSIDEVNDALHLALRGEDVDTIGGLMSERLGRLLAHGDVVEINGAELRVDQIDGRRVRKIRIRHTAAEAAGASPERE